jgi:Tfp pilus assembly protein PilV
MRGFSLVEVLISALILAFLVIGISAVLNLGNLTYPVDTALLDLQQQTRLGMDRMLRELRAATGPSISGNNTVLTFNTLTETNVQYSLDTANNRVIRTNGTSRILANDITSLTFCCWHGGVCDATCSSSNVLQIQLGGAKNAMGKTLSFSLTGKIQLRNE